MTAVGSRGRALALALVTLGGCASAPSMPELPPSHPAHPHAEQAPVPPRPPTLALPVDPDRHGLPADARERQR